ncbi:MAG: hypothetical protein ABL973_12690 [Micropepsaceae bacterium]
MIDYRIDDPTTISDQDIETILREGPVHPVVQFSRPVYTPALLRSINSLCATFGARLEVRFYGFGHPFDATVLENLPDVRHLSIDCLDEIRNEDKIGKLLQLEILKFGVYRFNKPKFLGSLNIAALRELVVGGTASKNIDLAPIEAGGSLETLFIQGHTKNIEALATLPKLRHLGLSGMPKGQSFSFANGIPLLRTLKVMLGSRSDFDEFAHEHLEELEIVWVRGLESLGDLRRFPALSRLSIQDQLQLRSITLAGSRLRTLFVHNCRNLTNIAGLESQPCLEHFRTSRTKLDLNALISLDWPATMKSVSLYSGSKKWNAHARTALAKRGYTDGLSLHSDASSA